MPLEPWQLYWAKTDRDTRGTDEHDAEWTRPLWAHLLDVGHTALLLWERVVPDGLRRQAAASLGLTDREAGSWLAFWIGLHDLGKASPSFQFQDPNAAYLRRMRADGFTLEPGALTASSRLHHGHATIAILSRDLTGGDPDAPLRFKESLGAFVGFHHGRLLDRTAWRRHALSDAVLGGPHWAHAQGVLLSAVYAAWAERYGLTAPRCEPEPAPAWLLGLAGWATLADWLGSLAAAFPRETGTDPAAYLDVSLRRSRGSPALCVIMRRTGPVCAAARSRLGRTSAA